jgi:hypothetical protein
MRVLTVRQPWAWAIIHGGKDVENRVRNIAGGYRGPVAIHVAQADAESAPESVWLAHAEFYRRAYGRVDPSWKGTDRGNIIGVVDLVDVHDWADCLEGVFGCSPWAQSNSKHLVLTNPRPLAEPIPFKGALGLRTLDDLTTTAVLIGIQQ